MLTISHDHLFQISHARQILGNKFTFLDRYVEVNNDKKTRTIRTEIAEMLY